MAQEIELLSANSIGALKTALDAFFDGKAATLVVQRLSIVARDLARFTGVEYRAEIVYDETAGDSLAAKFTVESYSDETLASLQQTVNSAIAAAPTELWYPLPLEVIDTVRRLNNNVVIFLRNTAANAITNVQPTGEKAPKVTSITDADSPYTAVPGETVYADASSAPVTVNLPAAADFGSNEVTVIKTDGSGNAVTLDPDGAETLNGSATVAFTAQYTSKVVISDSTELFIKAES